MEKKFPRFSTPLFLVVNFTTAGLFIYLASILFPELFAIASAQSWFSIFATAILFHFVTCFIEFFFHRYVLHKNLPLLGHFYKKHTHHHSLTTISMSGELNSNEYPILKEEQYDASFFPWYTLALFSLVLTPFFVLVAYLSPTTPILISGYIAMMWAIVLYEFIHQALHLPFEKWEKLISNKRFGSLVRTAYSLHLAHHANPRNNESISGFFGIPVADMLFGTYKIPRNLYTPKEPAFKEDYIQTHPVWFIRKLDILTKR